MGTIPTTVNKGVQSVDQIISAAVYDVGVASASAALKTAMPFLALPGLSQAIDLLLRYLAGFIYVGLTDFATIQIITLQTETEKYAYAQAESALRIAHASGDQAAIDIATKAFKDAFRSIVHYDGSANA